MPVAGPLAGEVRKGGTKHARQHEVIRQGLASPSLDFDPNPKPSVLARESPPMPYYACTPTRLQL